MLFEQSVTASTRIVAEQRNRAFLWDQADIRKRAIRHGFAAIDKFDRALGVVLRSFFRFEKFTGGNELLFVFQAEASRKRGIVVIEQGQAGQHAGSTDEQDDEGAANLVAKV